MFYKYNSSLTWDNNPALISNIKKGSLTSTEQEHGEYVQGSGYMDSHDAFKLSGGECEDSRRQGVVQRREGQFNRFQKG